MRNLHLAQILFNRPLMITESKLAVILHVLGQRLNLEVSALPQAEAAQISDHERRRAGYTAQGGIGIIGIYGPLVHRQLASDYLSGGPTTYGEIQKAFDLAMVDDSVSSIVFDLDTPGGEVNGVFDLADHIFNARGQKPITAVINESALSAGYLLASAADRIIIPRTGAAGSIGVVATHADLSRAEDAAGIKITHVYAGARKADFSPHAPLSEEACAVLQASVNEAYGLFVKTVARNRNMTEKAVRETEAGVFDGKMAVTAGLADGVASADQAIKNSLGKRKPIASAMAASTGTACRAPTVRTPTVPQQEERKMNIEELRSNHPELLEKIEQDARAGMVSEAVSQEAAKAAVSAEQARVCGLVAAAFGEETGKKFTAVASKGLSVEDLTALGINFGDSTPAPGADAESRAAILTALQRAAAEGLKGVQPGGAAAERSAAVSTIAAGGSKKR